MTSLELLGHLLLWSGFILAVLSALLTLALIAINDDTDRHSHMLLSGTLFLGGAVEVVGLVLSA